ncbi:COP9 signalosome complex subunit 4 [Colletotrichum fructicola]|nr:COP9 signalosome complex subunit 4 [Colletotrichum fructicola]
MAPSQKVAERLAQAASAGDKAAAYEAIIADIKNLSSPPTITSDLNAVLDAFFAASLGIVSTRAVLTTFVKVLRDLKNDDLWIAVGTHTLSQLSAQPSSFLDQAAAVRELVAEAHENNEDFLDAAKSLAEIPLDGSQRKVTNDDKARVWVRIARNYLEVDDTTAAETYVNKLKNIMHTVQDRDLDLHFKLSQARILDSKRDFLGASNRYHEISLSPAIAEEERLHTLSMAVKCAILAPAGPMRSRALGKLYKDERSAGLDEFGMLEKMFFDRLLAPAEVEKFAQGLQPHQLATTADGSTVLAKAVVEHNLLGASRLYRNIGFEALGSLLGLDGEKAEETTARMIEQGRLLGRIDQLEEVIWFEGGEASGQKGSGRAEVTVGKEMRQWDANVQSMAEEVENVTNALQKQFPVSTTPFFDIFCANTANSRPTQEFVEANLVV